MKILVISDIHLGNVAYEESTFVPPEPMDRQEFQKFADEIHSHKPDILICLGDCGETVLWDDHLDTFFEMYKNPHGLSIVIPGNHDLWLCRPHRMTHEEKFDAFFKTAEKHGWIGIREKPFSIVPKDETKGIWIAGGIGWYDLSFRSDAFSHMKPKEMDERIFEKQAWSDYINMAMRNCLPVYERRMREFRENLAQVPPPDQRKSLIVISHFVGFERLLGGTFPAPNWGRAFMGATGLGEAVVQAEPNLYLCGHTHRRVDSWIGNIHAICNGSGYGKGAKIYDIFEI